MCNACLTSSSSINDVHYTEISLKSKKLDNSVIMTAELLHIHKLERIKLFLIKTNTMKFSLKAKCMSNKLV